MNVPELKINLNTQAKLFIVMIIGIKLFISSIQHHIARQPVPSFRRIGLTARRIAGGKILHRLQIKANSSAVIINSAFQPDSPLSVVIKPATVCRIRNAHCI